MHKQESTKKSNMFGWIIKLFKKKEKRNLNNSSNIGGFYMMDKPTNDRWVEDNAYRHERERINEYMNHNQDNYIISQEDTTNHSVNNSDNYTNQDYSSNNYSNYNDSTNYDSTNNFDSGYSSDNNNW